MLTVVSSLAWPLPLSRGAGGVIIVLSLSFYLDQQLFPISHSKHRGRSRSTFCPDPCVSTEHSGLMILSEAVAQRSLKNGFWQSLHSNCISMATLSWCRNISGSDTGECCPPALGAAAVSLPCQQYPSAGNQIHLMEIGNITSVIEAGMR